MSEFKLYDQQENESTEKPASQTGQSDDACILEMTPSKPAEKIGISDELILTPSVPDDQHEIVDLTLESSNIIKVEEITFEGEEDAAARIEEAMIAYDKAMDQAAGIE